MEENDVLVSVIIPVYNGAQYLSACLEGVLAQQCQCRLEVSVVDDGSTDDTAVVLERYRQRTNENLKWIIRHSNGTSEPTGVAWAKNTAVKQSTGDYLCFMDADDVSLPDRIQLQLLAAQSHPIDHLTLFGCKFRRDPPEATVRYAKWANGLTQKQLELQVFTANGPTVIAPTWFMSRALFDAVGGFREDANSGFPEDLDFFYRALFDLKGPAEVIIERVEREMVIYRHHSACASLNIGERRIWDMRLGRFEEQVLSNLTHFSVWNAGKQGRRFLKSLSKDSRSKVVSMCDVDPRKLSRGVYEEYDSVSRRVTSRIPIVHWRTVSPPVVICVKLDMTDGAFETALATTGWVEGVDFWYFS